MEFRILGPVQARHRGHPVPLGGSRRRAVLAALLLGSGRVVPLDQLVRQVWGDDPPPGARNTAQVHVSRLRRALSTDPQVELTAQGSGYLLRVSPEQVDLHRFRRLVAAAKASNDQAAVSRLLADALRLWRGPALADVSTGQLTEGVRAGLEEERLAAQELRITADLRLHRHAELVEELSALAAAHPLRERPTELLMLALYRSGRATEALAVYQRARGALAEAGSEPGPTLRLLHERMVRGDPGLLPPAHGRRPALPGPPGQRAPLPPPPFGLVGRTAEVERALALVRTGEPAHGTVAGLGLVRGPGGSGTTALALHLAHELAVDFPDGQFFVDLLGHTRGHEPMSPAAVLEVLLRAVRVPPDELPAGVTERAARWRELVADQRVLVVLDNATHATQVRPLLTGCPDSLVLVTSREPLTDLPVRFELALAGLPQGAAEELFTELAGPARAAVEPDAVAEVVRLCERLPLAVRLAAARLRQRPSWSVAHLAGRLRGVWDAVVRPGEPDRGVQVAFELTYQQLDPALRRALRLLGLAPGTAITPHLLGALLNEAPERAERLLRQLADAHLVEFREPGRYLLPDLVRGYAAARVAAEVTEPERQAARRRLLDWYLHTARAADRLLTPARHRVPEGAPRQQASPPLVFDSVDAALAWFDTERDSLVAAVRAAATHHETARAWQLAAVQARYFEARGRWADWQATHEAALALVVRDADRRGEAHLRTGLGAVLDRQGDHEGAREQLRRAAELHRELVDLRGEARTLAVLGGVCRRLGRYREALEHLRQHLVLAERLGDQHSQATALADIGALYRDVGQHTEAVRHLDAALGLLRHLGDRSGEAATLERLGGSYLRLGLLAEAQDHLLRALTTYRETGDRHGEVRALSGVAAVYEGMGRFAEAFAQHQRAIDLVREVGSPGLEARAVAALAQTLLLGGRVNEALTRYRQALRLATDHGDALPEALALDGIGRCLDQHGERAAAVESWRQSLAILNALRHPQADSVRARLSAAH